MVRLGNRYFYGMAQIYTANALFQINFIHSHIFLLALWIDEETPIQK